MSVAPPLPLASESQEVEYILDEELCARKKKGIDSSSIFQANSMMQLKIVILMISLYAMATQYSLICCHDSGTGSEVMPNARHHHKTESGWSLAQQFQYQLDKHFSENASLFDLDSWRESLELQKQKFYARENDTVQVITEYENSTQSPFKTLDFFFWHK